MWRALTGDAKLLISHFRDEVLLHWNAGQRIFEVLTNGSRNFSDLLDAIQVLARRPMSQISSSFPSYCDEWDDSTDATEYYDIDDHNAVDNDGYYDEYDEPEDHDNDLIDMSGIPEDATFEEPELACMLESLQKGKKGSSKEARKAGARVSPVMF